MSLWIEFATARPRAWSVCSFLAATLAVGYLDFATGERYSAHILYFPIISLACWMSGLAPAIALAMLASVLWLADDFMIPPTRLPDFLKYWESFGRFVVFSGFAYVLWRLRKAVAHEQQLSRYDELTGLANRTSLFEAGKRDLAWCRQTNKPITAVFIDVDEFKSVNDRCGHAAGDEVLRVTAECLREHTRKTDITSRIGGDEFVVVAPEMSAEAAESFIKRLQERLRDTMRDHCWPVTFSIGAATYNTAPASLDELIKAADDLMYTVKHREKNSVNHTVMDLHLHTLGRGKATGSLAR